MLFQYVFFRDFYWSNSANKNCNSRVITTNLPWLTNVETRDLQLSNYCNIITDKVIFLSVDYKHFNGHMDLLTFANLSIRNFLYKLNFFKSNRKKIRVQKKGSRDEKNIYKRFFIKKIPDGKNWFNALGHV
jgi:hypothetical protein